MTLLEFYRAHWLTMLKLEPKLLERMLTAAQHGGGEWSDEWRKLQRTWTRPAAFKAKMRNQPTSNP